MSEEKLHFDDLKISFGQIVEVLPQQSGTKEFSDVMVLGAIPDQSIIISAPESGIFPKMQEGEKVIFRVLLADGIAVFETSVLFISDIPMFMVYLDFPQEVSFKRIRNATRVSVTLPVLVSNLTTGEQVGVAGKITDISTTGAGIELFEELGSVGENINMKGKFAVGSIQRLLSIKGIIRTAKKKPEGAFVYGIEFLEDDENDLLVLFGFIFNAMAFGKIQKIR